MSSSRMRFSIKGDSSWFICQSSICKIYRENDENSYCKQALALALAKSKKLNTSW